MKKLFVKRVAARKRERGSAIEWIILVLLIIAAVVPAMLLVSKWITQKSYFYPYPMPHPVHNPQLDPGTSAANPVQGFPVEEFGPGTGGGENGGSAPSGSEEASSSGGPSGQTIETNSSTP